MKYLLFFVAIGVFIALVIQVPGGLPRFHATVKMDMNEELVSGSGIPLNALNPLNYLNGALKKAE